MILRNKGGEAKPILRSDRENSPDPLGPIHATFLSSK